MSRADVLHTRWTELRAMARVAPLAPRFLPRAPWSLARLLEECARQHGDRPGILFEDRRYTWSEVDREVDRAMRAFVALGIERGDVVALLMDNRPEFLFALTALNRMRAAGALINTNIAGTALGHAIRIVEPVAILAGREHRDKVEAVLPQLEAPSKDQVWIQGEARVSDPGAFRSFDALLAESRAAPAPRRPRPDVDDRLGFIYTSGTTGLPKAAIVTNKRVMAPGAVMGRAILELTPDDVVYITTPLYHSVGIYIGWGSTLTTGATLALRRKFSASKFWDDVRRFGVTAFVYIGELCRYLLNQPVHPHERDHRIRVASGNGLRPDIWEEFQQRFGIPLIREYYGATEGNNMTINFTGRPGMVGRLMQGAQLVRCDLETGEPLRNASGRCEAVAVGETGLFVAPISRLVPFDGYADESATRKKVLRDVFRRGDRYFNSGDLMVLHDDGWVAFADRVGDTFRWKGENVSTNEVAEILNGAPGVLETNVYGVAVPGAEGRAGMASVNCGPDFAIEDFARFVVEHLPGYQRPVFVRLQQEMRITGTFKHQKVEYRREGYDPSRVGDPLYLLEGERYVPLEAEVYAGLRDGSRVIR
jgi:acyl-CoA synthetase (AMP-forming)/AMP-acid ligase II